MIIVIKNIELEGPGLIGEFFSGRGYSIRTIELEKGEALPENIEGTDAVICLGGPMNVYEEEKYPFLKEEDVFIKKVIEGKVPFLGICLGAQLLAKASGAAVEKAPQEEIGFFKVSLTGEGKSDRLFSGMECEELEVFQWHGDTFGIPEGETLLARADTCKNQALRVGDNAYGLQFHLEVDGSIISDWVKEYFDSDDPILKNRAENILLAYNRAKKELHKNAETICRNFEEIINSSRGV